MAIFVTNGVPYARHTTVCLDMVGEAWLLSLLAGHDPYFFWSSTYSLGEVVIQNGNLPAPGAPL